MKDVTTAISQNFKRLREEKKLSLDSIAKLSGVSKSMLGQIERGEVNPTIATIWKITNGLKVSFTALLAQPQVELEVLRKDDITPLVEDSGRLRNFPQFPFDENRRFETYYVELDPGCAMAAEPHLQGSQEYITVTSGELTLVVSGQTNLLRAGDSIRFRADAQHAYYNKGEQIIQLSMLIYYAPV